MARARVSGDLLNYVSAEDSWSSGSSSGLEDEDSAVGSSDEVTFVSAKASLPSACSGLAEGEPKKGSFYGVHGYVSAEDSLSSVSSNFEDGQSSMGSSASEKSFEAAGSSFEPEDVDPLDKEVILSVDTTNPQGADLKFQNLDRTEGTNRVIIAREIKREEALIRGEIELSRQNSIAEESYEQDTKPPTSSDQVALPLGLRRRHGGLKLPDGRASIQFSNDNASSPRNTCEMRNRPVDMNHLVFEDAFEPFPCADSLDGSSNDSRTLNSSREVPISDAFSDITNEDPEYLSTDVSGICSNAGNGDAIAFPETEGQAHGATPSHVSEDGNDLETCHRDRHDLAQGEDVLEELEDRQADLNAEGDLDDLRWQRHGVFKVPEERNHSETSYMSWPASLLSQTIDFEIKIIMFGISIVMWFYNLLIIEPINLTVLGKDTVLLGVRTVFSTIFFVIEFLEHLPRRMVPMLKKIAKKLGIGFLYALYISIILGLLLMPAFVLGVLFVGSYVEKPLEMQERLYFDYTMPRPNATVSLFPAHVLPKVTAIGAQHPEKVLSKRLIPPNHKFHVMVNLRMPESEHNFHIGMFQVSAELISLKGEVIRRFTRPCILRFHNWPIRYAKVLFMSVPLLLGLYSESQVVTLHLIDSYEDRLNPTASLKILLESRVGYALGGGLPEIYGADVIIQSELPWVKSIIYHWKWALYIWSGLGFFFFELALVLCCCRQVLIPQLSSRVNYRAMSGGAQGNQREVLAFHESLAAPNQREYERRESTCEDIPIASVVSDPLFGSHESVQNGEVSRDKSTNMDSL